MVLELEYPQQQLPFNSSKRYARHWTNEKFIWVYLLLFIDLSKAFDLVNYDKLLSNLYNIRAGGVAYDWFVW
jgi:hypothetical protein